MFKPLASCHFWLLVYKLVFKSMTYVDITARLRLFLLGFRFIFDIQFSKSNTSLC